MAEPVNLADGTTEIVMLEPRGTVNTADAARAGTAGELLAD